MLLRDIYCEIGTPARTTVGPPRYRIAGIRFSEILADGIIRRDK